MHVLVYIVFGQTLGFGHQNQSPQGCPQYHQMQDDTEDAWYDMHIHKPMHILGLLAVCTAPSIQGCQHAHKAVILNDVHRCESHMLSKSAHVQPPMHY